MNHRRQVAVIRAAPKAETKRRRDLAEVGEADAGIGAASNNVVGKKIGLRLADGVVAVVVEDENFHRQALTTNRLRAPANSS